jgi:ubiquinone/menaquinone biosynthesis C-methylase UbiE
MRRGLKLAYVYMKYLESRPEKYDEGISKLAHGIIEKINEHIANYVHEGDRVLDIGCGTGALTIRCARKRAKVVAIDKSPALLEIAKKKALDRNVSDKIDFIEVDAVKYLAGQAQFNVIVSSLALSEMNDMQIQLVLHNAWQSLKIGGLLVLVDEVVPHKLSNKIYYHLIRGFYRLLTSMRVKGITWPIRDLTRKIQSAGFHLQNTQHYLHDTLELHVAQKTRERHPVIPIPHSTKFNLVSRLRELYCILFGGFRRIPTEPGLYVIGKPNQNSPVLVTANYFLTVQRVKRALASLDSYLLVADTKGINVWCSARGDHFTAEEVADIVKTSRIEELVNHKQLILPQLSAGGVDHLEVKNLTGWTARFGPNYAKYITEYIQTGRKTKAMREVTFTLVQRLEASVQHAFFISWKLLKYPIIILTLLTLFFQFLFPWELLLLELVFIVWAMCLSLGALFYAIPTSSFLIKGMIFGAMGSIASSLFLWSGSIPNVDLFNWSLGMFALGVFITMDFSGMTPISNPRSIEREYMRMIYILVTAIILGAVTNILWRAILS